jgi:hypothetical protein
MNLNEILYTIQNKPYFKIHVLSHGRIVRNFTQVAGGNDSAEAFFLICKPIKCAWWKPFTPVIDGLKFITYVDLTNAIPLKFEKETIYESTDFVTRTIEVTTIKEDIEKQKERGIKDGLPNKLVEIPHPPDLLYEIVDAHFVTKILTPPPDKFDILNWKWILIIGAGLVLWYWLNGGKLF